MSGGGSMMVYTYSSTYRRTQFPYHRAPVMHTSLNHPLLEILDGIFTKKYLVQTLMNTMESSFGNEWVTASVTRFLCHSCTSCNYIARHVTFISLLYNDDYNNWNKISCWNCLLFTLSANSDASYAVQFQDVRLG